MPFCHQCGTEVQEDDRFCIKCGVVQQEEHRQTVSSSEGSFSVQSEREQPVSGQSLNYKGVGIRFIAQLVDAVICLILYGIIGSITASIVGGKTPDGFAIEGTAAVIVQALTVLFSIFYFALFEAFWNGQTLGKKVTRIQVVNEDGSAIDLGTALIRNVLRPVDAFCFYLVAAISVWMSPRKQRIGDRVAQTCVVKKQSVPGNKAKKAGKVKFSNKDDVFISDID